MKEINQTVSHFQESIFATLTKESKKNQAINLSQGFPDFDGPQWIVELAKKELEETKEGCNQYAPLEGIPSLRAQVQEMVQKQYGLEYNQDSEITITHGATEGIFCSIMAVVNPGDEVIVFEPFYDSYYATIKLAGGIPVPVTLHSPDFKFNEQELEKAFTQKTKLLVMNNPHNPTGRVFLREELEKIAKLVKQHDTYLVSDEVYEFLTYDELSHIPMASIDGMKERVFTLSSIGKTFGLTGWKTGWALASEELTKSLRNVHQYTTFCANHPTQRAVAKALANLESYLPEFRSLYQKKRDRFVQGLKDLDFDPFCPQGTYFVMCPIRKKTNLKDVDYCLKLMKENQVASIPPSAFYAKSKEGEDHLRFCFAKKESTLEKSLQQLQSLKS